MHLQGTWLGVSHRYSAGGRPDRTNRDHHLAASQGDSVPVVFVRRRLRGRATVRPRCRQGWRATSPFAIVQCVLCLAVPVAIVKLAGYDLGYAAGFYSGSQTISAAMGLSTDAINRLGLAADQAKNLLNSMPVAYAVTYMFGTVGSAIVIALLGPFLLRFDIAAACKDYEEKQGGSKELGGPGTAWHRWEVRAFRVQPGARVIGLRAAEAEALLPQARVFIQRIRRNAVIEDATADTV